jgi:hypothetical protein
MKRHNLKRRMEFLQLRTPIASQLAHFHPDLRKTLLHNLAELVTATALARHIHLAKIGDELPVDTSDEARIQWVRRQLANDTEAPLTLFAPVVQALVGGRPEFAPHPRPHRPG